MAKTEALHRLVTRRLVQSATRFSSAFIRFDSRLNGIATAKV